ncbi:MAG: hypothetical protein HY508_16440, partial [Acidobacteria bacterium]|nr:hypothetical protein [Acidobacteriota bacterium]
MNRREIVVGTVATLATTLAGAPTLTPQQVESAGSSSATANGPSPDSEQWLKFDAEMRTWWDKDLIHATEDTIRSDESKTLLFLPFPYLRISVGTTGTYQAQFPVDTAFMNYALFAHDRLDIVRNHLLNHIFMIERYGFAPNANYKGLLTRSQTPFFVLPTFWRYYSATKDLDFLYRAYPLLKREYQQYW